MMPHAHLAHVPGAAGPGFVPLAAMWFVMMAAMMAPTVWPWVRAFHRFDAVDPGGAGGAGTGGLFGASGALGAGRRARGPRAIGTAVFGAGYLAAWLVYSLGAALLHLALQRTGVFDPGHGLGPAAGAAILVAAGLYQFAPLKRACLTHCRNPFSFFLSRWRSGPAAGFRMGLLHGLFCVGCCWALMLTALAVGVMSLWWMAALAGVAFVEQVAPRGDLLRVPLGIALVVAGVLRM